MEKCKIESSFCVANQFVHVKVKGEKGTFIVRLPVKFASALAAGNRFDVFTSKKNGMHIAYRFKNQLLFATPVLNKQDASNVLQNAAGICDFSIDRLLLKYSVLMAMQNNGIRPSFSMVENIVKLKKENQR